MVAPQVFDIYVVTKNHLYTSGAHNIFHYSHTTCHSTTTEDAPSYIHNADTRLIQTMRRKTFKIHIKQSRIHRFTTFLDVHTPTRQECLTHQQKHSLERCQGPVIKKNLTGFFKQKTEHMLISFLTVELRGIQASAAALVGMCST